MSTTPTEPTPASLRAARALCPQIACGVDSGEFVPAMLTDRARQVDEATGLPELIAALEAVDRCLSGDMNYEHACLTADTTERAKTPARVVRAALAKVRKA